MCAGNIVISSSSGMCSHNLLFQIPTWFTPDVGTLCTPGVVARNWSTSTVRKGATAVRPCDTSSLSDPLSSQWTPRASSGSGTSSHKNSSKPSTSIRRNSRSQLCAILSPTRTKFCWAGKVSNYWLVLFLIVTCHLTKNCPAVKKINFAAFAMLLNHENSI